MVSPGFQGARRRAVPSRTRCDCDKRAVAPFAGPVSRLSYRSDHHPTQ